MNIKMTSWFMALVSLCFFSANVLAVDFSFTDTQGKSHDLSQYKGKWVVVNFWATWCPPCRKEMPDLADFHQEHEDAVVIGVNYEPGLNEGRLQKFVEIYRIPFPVTRVSKAITGVLGEPRGLPTSVLIDPQGNIVKQVTGMVNENMLNEIILQYEKKVAQIK